MITENLSTLKIHKLTQEQYERELATGRIDENALYLTPYEEMDLDGFATQEYVDEALAQKQPIGDYALKSEIPTDYLTEIPAEYITETELNAKGYLTEHQSLDGKQDKITGTAGDFVIIGEDGNVTTKTIPYAEEAEF